MTGRSGLFGMRRVLNAQDDYTKNRNYWKYLKTKLKNEGNEVVSATNQLKLMKTKQNSGFSSSGTQDVSVAWGSF